MPPVGEMYRRIHETCVSAFAGADCYSLGIPWNATADDTRSFIDGHQLLEQG